MDSNKRSKVFRDPVHGLISIDEDRELLLDLIDTPEFQRLRRIRQLGVSSLTYPGAEHTRFAHSLGVLHVATRIMRVLEQRHGEDKRVESDLSGKRRFVKAAALLHDIGHGPFSHMIERAFSASKQHEERSRRMIDDKASEILGVLRNHVNESEIQEIKNLLAFHEQPFLHDIVSSSLDADRMDYLLRDSHFTGVEYGNFDLEWVINSFCLGLESHPEGANNKRRWRLCLDEKRGLHASEQLIMARAHMTMQVYGHRTTRLWESHLLMLFHEATRLASEGLLPSGTPVAVSIYFERKGEVDHATFLQIDEPALLASLTIWASAADSTGRLSEFSNCYLRRRSPLLCKELHETFHDPEALALLRKQLEDTIGPESEKWLLDKYDFQPYKAPPEGQKKTDPEGFWEAVSKDAILLASGDLGQQAVAIHERSKVLGLLGRQKMPLVRLFFLPDVEGKIEALTAQIIQGI